MTTTNTVIDNKMQKEWFDVVELAHYLGINEETVRRRIRTKDIRAIRLGLGYRIMKDEAERLSRDGFSSFSVQPVKSTLKERHVDGEGSDIN